MASLSKSSPTQTEKPIIKLISFGSGMPGIDLALARLKRQANACDLVDRVSTYTENDLGDDYFRLFEAILERPSKGFGFWSWKPYLISRELETLKEGDILIYLDAGVEINPKGRARFTEYLDQVAREDILVFSQPAQHRHWTKPDKILISNDRHYFRNQVVAGILMFRVCEKSKRMVDRWLDLSAHNGGLLLTDADTLPSEWPPTIRAHRHDQSVLSRVVFEEGLMVTKDETYFEPWSKGSEAPFLALRNKQTSRSWLWAAFNLPRPLFTVWQYLTLFMTPGVAASKVARKWARLSKKGQSR
jgi:hypothetical protein